MAWRETGREGRLRGAAHKGRQAGGEALSGSGRGGVSKELYKLLRSAVVYITPWGKIATRPDRTRKNVRIGEGRASTGGGGAARKQPREELQSTEHDLGMEWRPVREERRRYRRDHMQDTAGRNSYRRMHGHA